MREVEAEICDNCGEAYYSLETTNKIQQLVKDAVDKGAEIEIVRIAYKKSSSGSGEIGECLGTFTNSQTCKCRLIKSMIR